MSCLQIDYRAMFFDTFAIDIFRALPPSSFLPMSAFSLRFPRPPPHSRLSRRHLLRPRLPYERVRAARRYGTPFTPLFGYDAADYLFCAAVAATPMLRYADAAPH